MGQIRHMPLEGDPTARQMRDGGSWLKEVLIEMERSGWIQEITGR